MSKTLKLEVTTRNTQNKGENKRLRKSGVILGVAYGKNIDPVSIQVNEKVFQDQFQHGSGDNTLVNLSIDKKKSQLSLMKGMQVNPITDKVLHVDFQLVKEDEVIHTTVPIHLTGESIGVKNGGVLEHQIHTLDIHCQTKYLPDSIDVDISKIEIGDSLHVKDIDIPENIEVNTNPDVIVALVAESRAMLAAGETGDAADTSSPSEPEVLTEKVKKED